ncbi:hypothetical protein VE03_09697 [Pseudogymnoascus sp. 23342-1-I1]|nr:hypothetical protein VE03_09697 [Pseudogymnoascus sp. 23342-1-I1]
MAVAMGPYAEPPQVRNEPKRLWITKLSLRCISSALCLSVVGLGSATYYVEILLVAPTGVTLAWNIAEGITLIARRRTYKGIHPGACVGVDLILWLALAICTGLLAPGLGYYPWGGQYYYDAYANFATLFIVAVSFSIIATLIQISLFIIACIETHRRRKGIVPLAPVPFNTNQLHGAFNPNQQPGTFNPNQPHAPFNSNAPFNPHQQPGAFIPTTFPPTSPFQSQPGMQQYYPPPGAYTQAQTQTHAPSPQSSAAQPHHQSFGQATVTPAQPPQWPGAQGVHHEMSSSPAPQTVPTAGRFNGGPPHAVGGFTASPRPQYELSGGTPAPGPGPATAGFSSAAQSQAGSPPPMYEI